MTEQDTTQGKTNGNGGRCPVTHMSEVFDPFKGEPYAEWAQARKEEPVFYSPEIDHWVVTRDEDVRTVMMDNETYSARNVLALITPPGPAAGQILMENQVMVSPSIVDEDPPVHAPHRKALRQAFTPRKVKAMEPDVRETVRRQIDSFVKRGEADMVGDFMFEVSARVLFRAMGVPEDEMRIVRQYVKRLAVLGWGIPTEEEQVELAEAVAGYWRYAWGHVDRLLEKPGDDVISVFINALREAPEGDLFDRVYVNTIMMQLLFAGQETTANAMAGGFKALLSDRAQWEELCENPSLIPNAVEEILRFAGSVPQWRRLTTKDVELGGVKIPQNSQLLVALGSANRDENRFENGDKFDIHRENAKNHVGFGHGPHLCLGAPLARLEMNVALQEITQRIPHMNLVEGQEYPYSPNTSHRGPEEVHVKWDPQENPVPEDRP